MEFPTKLWKDRVAEYLNRRRLINSATSEEIVFDVEREEGLVREPGNQFSALEMNDLESRINTSFQAVQTETTKYTDDQDKLINLKITTLTNSVPIIQKSFTLTLAGWTTYTESGKTLYRQLVTGVTAKVTDRFDCTCSAYYESLIYASLIPINTGGSLYVTTSIKPTVNIVIQVFLTPTRAN